MVAYVLLQVIKRPGQPGTIDPICTYEEEAIAEQEAKEMTEKMRKLGRH